MKRYNRIDYNWVIVSIVLPMLMFFLSMTSVYAYFTATAKKQESELTTAIIRVGFTDDTAATISSNSITDSSRIVPGDTLEISGAVQNIGNSDIYTIIHYELFTQKINEEEIQIVDKYYTFNGSTKVEIQDLSNPDDTIPAARKLTADSETMLGETVDFNLSHKFDFYDYDNSYQNATARYLITAHAIQVQNLEDGVQATQLLMPLESTNYPVNYISGNSLQASTPTPTSPVEIQSVGEKTNNLFNPTLNFTGYNYRGVSITYSETEDCYILNGTATATASYGSREINLTATKGTTYTVTAHYISGAITRPNSSDYVCPYFGASDTIGSYPNWLNIHCYDYNTSASKVCNNNYITRFWFYITSGVSFNNYKVRIQLEEGSTATEYEPFGYKIPIKVSNGSETTIHNIYLDEPLRKVGDVADYIDFKNGTVVRNVDSLKLSGTESWSLYTWETSIYQMYTTNLKINGIASASAYSNIVPYGVTSANRQNYQLGVYTVTSGTEIAFQIIGYSSTITVNEWKEFLENSDVVVHYQLAKAISESVDLPDLSIYDDSYSFTVETIVPATIK